MADRGACTTGVLRLRLVLLRGSDKSLSFLTSCPRICRACRPTISAATLPTTGYRPAVVKWQSWRLLRCSFSDCQPRPCRAPSALRSLLGHRSARRGRGTGRCSTGGAGSAGAPDGHAPRRGAGYPRRSIEHASNSPRKLRAIEHASRYPLFGALPPTNPGRGTRAPWNSPQASASKRPGSRAGFSHFYSEPKTRQCRAADQRPVKATRYAGGRTRPTLTGAGGAHA